MSESIALKRSRLVSLIAEARISDLRGSGVDDPSADLGAIARDVAGLPEGLVDDLLKRYEPSGHVY